MQVTAAQIAQLVGGKVEGNPDTLVHGPSKIEEGGPGTITFLANPKYEQFAYQTTASVLLVSEDFEPQQAVSATLIRVKDVYQSLAVLLGHYEKMQASGPEGQSELAFVHAEAKIDATAKIGPFAVVEKGAVVGPNCQISGQVYLGPNVKIGANSIIYPGARIYRDCVIGESCIIHSNAVIGSDGFGFAPNEQGGFDKIPQVGNVVLGDQVEIGANTVIDRATMGSTRIHAGAKLDNLIQIAHNVEIGSNTVIAAQAGIAGSTKVGKNVMIGGQAGFVGHIEIADGVKVQAQSGIAAAIKEEGKAVYGSPAIPYGDYLRAYAVFKQLPALKRQVNELQKEINTLKKNTEE